MGYANYKLAGEFVVELKIIQPITVKAVVTDHLKYDLLRELEGLLKQTETEIEYLSFKIKRTSTELDKKHSEDLSTSKNELEIQKSQNYEKIRIIKENMDVINKLSLDEEIVKGTVDRIIHVKVGDNWKDIENCEVLLKDDKVIEIRKVEV